MPLVGPASHVWPGPRACHGEKCLITFVLCVYARMHIEATGQRAKITLRKPQIRNQMLGYLG
jgi:hypothetical protein